MVQRPHSDRDLNLELEQCPYSHPIDSEGQSRHVSIVKVKRHKIDQGEKVVFEVIEFERGVPVHPILDRA